MKRSNAWGWGAWALALSACWSGCSDDTTSHTAAAAGAAGAGGGGGSAAGKSGAPSAGTSSKADGGSSASDAGSAATMPGGADGVGADGGSAGVNGGSGGVNGGNLAGIGGAEDTEGGGAGAGGTLTGSGGDGLGGAGGEGALGPDGICESGADLATFSYCDCADECESGTCGSASLGPLCVQPCTERADCGPGEGCFKLLGQSKVCVPDPTGSSCAGDNGPEPSACGFAARCVAARGASATPAYFCGGACENAAACGPGATCSPIRCAANPALGCLFTADIAESPDKEDLLASHFIELRVCTPAGNANACATPSDAAACLSGECDASASACTGQCWFTSDYPSGTCTSVDESDATLPIRVCNP